MGTYYTLLVTLLQLNSRAQPQGELPGWAGVVLDEVLDLLGDRLAREVASFLNLFGDLPRNVIGPMLMGVEGHHANRVIELPAQEIMPSLSQGPRVRCRSRVGGAYRSEVVQHEIHGRIGVSAHRTYLVNGITSASRLLIYPTFHRV